jgi:hypothetical protein
MVSSFFCLKAARGPYALSPFLSNSYTFYTLLSGLPRANMELNSSPSESFDQATFA